VRVEKKRAGTLGLGSNGSGIVKQTLNHYSARGQKRGKSTHRGPRSAGNGRRGRQLDWQDHWGQGESGGAQGPAAEAGD